MNREVKEHLQGLDYSALKNQERFEHDTGKPLKTFEGFYTIYVFELFWQQVEKWPL